MLLALALLPAVTEAVFLRDRVSWQQPRTAEEVPVAQAAAWGKTVLWLDARPEEDFIAAHVPGALSLTTEKWDEQLLVTRAQGCGLLQPAKLRRQPVSCAATA